MNKYNLLNVLSETIVIKTLEKEKEYTFDGIQIPMIQRDYAHGRESASEIRKRFLDSIFNAIENGNSLELDFIYGSIKQLDNKDYFIPLDGQQRLTTLFLLYWYIGNKELDSIQKLKLNDNLVNFTYATRATARDFCKKLCEIDIGLETIPRKEIENAAWFYDIYRKDPTVKSMLVMLDAIHDKYQLSKGNLFSNLSNLTFYILPLDGFELSDELYIKMNARGKQLTDFENFKADLINWLKDDKNPSRDVFQETVMHHDQKMPYYLAYATKLDTDWTTVFWELCVKDISEQENENDEDKKAVVDPYFTRFWNRYLLNAFIVKNRESSDNIEKSDFFSKFYGKEGKDELVSYESFDLHSSIFKKENVIKESEKVLDALSQYYNTVVNEIKPSWSKEDDWNLFDKDINQRQRILYYAISKYLEQNLFEIDKFRNWIRVVWNIIIDPDIRSIGAMINAMKLIDQLSVGSKNIYKYLTEDAVLSTINKSNFKSQLEEERLKAKLIVSDFNWEKPIIEAESHAMYMGNIGFLLDENISIPKFKSKFEIAKTLFNSKGSNNEFFKEYLIMRSVLSKIENWSTLQGLDFADSHFNWQFLLRKKEWIGKIIDGFCGFETIDELRCHMEELVSLESKIESWDDEDQAVLRARNAHKSFYTNGKFHSWLQEHKAINSKWWNYHFYIHRPRSHNDWVMVDVKRNELVTRLIRDYDFVTDQYCNDTNYFYGFRINLKRDFKDFCIEMNLDVNGDLNLGFSNFSKDFIMEFDVIEEDIENNIAYIKVYDYDEIITDTDVVNFMSIMDNEVFSETNKESIFYKLKNL
ncbi:DUF262 domain-containing protein [Winogradskyella sp. MH6]|uniref:DUF262 domain-containing protein n=1 Tax=Winogradskyella sp. MH6 TaxID=2929510 RepID=UPI001FB28F27|nr:DUF262 domain-containing protein [Winogradskyella sp. MH6]